jgi:hypothetical protein
MTSNNIQGISRIFCRLGGAHNASKASGRWVNARRARFEIVVSMVDFFMKIGGFGGTVGD